MRKIEKGGKTVAVFDGKEKLITDAASALDIIMTAKYEAGIELIAIDKVAVTNEFFILGSGLAGEVLQKFINYHAKFAVFGDYSHYTSKPLRDFIYESNNGRDVLFFG